MVKRWMKAGRRTERRAKFGRKVDDASNQFGSVVPYVRFTEGLVPFAARFSDRLFGPSQYMVKWSCLGLFRQCPACR